MILKLARRLLRTRQPSGPSFFFERPLVILQSDDWGRVGVRDKEGYEQLRASGVGLGKHVYDFYTLESADDLHALTSVFQRHHDSTGRSPCLVMNFVVSNLDFPRIVAGDFREIHLLPLAKGLPGDWTRPGLFEAYRHGIGAGVFYPALHGITHFCRPAAEHALAAGGEHGNLLRTMWQAQTPYIFWRMPWIGYEFHNPGKPEKGFLDPETQHNLARLAVEALARLFRVFPVSACAPGYRSNGTTHEAWSKWGIRVAQNGSGAPMPAWMDELGLLHLHRTIDIEPAQRDLPVAKYVQLAENCFARGLPAVVSMHSINFHSSLRNFREPTLQALDQFFSALESRFPKLLYLHDGDMYKLVTQGRFDAGQGTVSVTVRQQHAKVRNS